MRGMSKRNLIVGATFVGAIATLGVAQSVMQKVAAAQGKAAVQAPYFEVDPMWPKPLNKGWLYGNVIGLGVDAKDRVYIIHRVHNINIVVLRIRCAFDIRLRLPVVNDR